MMGKVAAETHGLLPLPAWEQPEDISTMNPLKFRALHKKLFAHKQRLAGAKGTLDHERTQREVAGLQSRAENLRCSRIRHQHEATLELKRENARLVERLCSVARDSEIRQRQAASTARSWPGMLNAAFRRKVAQQVDKDNKAMLERLKRAGPVVTSSQELAARYQCHKDYIQLHTKFRRRDGDLAKPPTPPRVRPPRRNLQPWRKALLPPLRASKKSEVTNFTGESETDKASEKGAGMAKLEDKPLEHEHKKDDISEGVLPGDVRSAAEGPDASVLIDTSTGEKESSDKAAPAAADGKKNAGDEDVDDYGDGEEFDDDFDDDEEASPADSPRTAADSPRTAPESPVVGKDGRLEGASPVSLGADNDAERDADEQPQDKLPAADAKVDADGQAEEAGSQAEADAGTQQAVEDMAEAGTAAEADAQAEPDSQAVADAQAEADVQVEANSQAEVGSRVEADGPADADAPAQADGQANADGQAHADAPAQSKEEGPPACTSPSPEPETRPEASEAMDLSEELGAARDGGDVSQFEDSSAPMPEEAPERQGSKAESQTERLESPAEGCESALGVATAETPAPAAFEEEAGLEEAPADRAAAEVKEAEAKAIVAEEAEERAGDLPTNSQQEAQTGAGAEEALEAQVADKEMAQRQGDEEGQANREAQVEAEVRKADAHAAAVDEIAAVAARIAERLASPLGAAGKDISLGAEVNAADAPESSAKPTTADTMDQFEASQSSQAHKVVEHFEEAESSVSQGQKAEPFAEDAELDESSLLAKTEPLTEDAELEEAALPTKPSVGLSGVDLKATTDTQAQDEEGQEESYSDAEFEATDPAPAETNEFEASYTEPAGLADDTAVMQSQEDSTAGVRADADAMESQQDDDAMPSGSVLQSQELSGQDEYADQEDELVDAEIAGDSTVRSQEQAEQLGRAGYESDEYQDEFLDAGTSKEGPAPGSAGGYSQDDFDAGGSAGGSAQYSQELAQEPIERTRPGDSADDAGWSQDEFEELAPSGSVDEEVDQDEVAAQDGFAGLDVDEESVKDDLEAQGAKDEGPEDADDEYADEKYEDDNEYEDDEEFENPSDDETEEEQSPRSPRRQPPNASSSAKGAAKTGSTNSNDSYEAEGDFEEDSEVEAENL